MKYLSLIVVPLFAWIQPAWGKLGESLTDIGQRYGKTIKVVNWDGIPGTKHNFQSFTVCVFFDGGKSIAESLVPTEDDRELGDEECLKLIRAISGVQDWKTAHSTVREMTTWVSGSGFFLATRYHSVGKADSLIVCTVGFTDLSAKNAKKKLDEMVTGFSALLPTDSSTPEGRQSSLATNDDTKAAAEIKSAERRRATEAATFKFHYERAGAGNLGSQFRLGQLYLTGLGCARDTNAARMWLQKAADGGSADAASELRKLPPR
jgi:TPR repeat protein